MSWVCKGLARCLIPCRAMGPARDLAPACVTASTLGNRGLGPQLSLVCCICALPLMYNIVWRRRGAECRRAIHFDPRPFQSLRHTLCLVVGLPTPPCTSSPCLAPHRPSLYTCRPCPEWPKHSYTGPQAPHGHAPHAPRPASLPMQPACTHPAHHPAHANQNSSTSTSAPPPPPASASTSCCCCRCCCC